MPIIHPLYWILWLLESAFLGLIYGFQKVLEFFCGFNLFDTIFYNTKIQEFVAIFTAMGFIFITIFIIWLLVKLFTFNQNIGNSLAMAFARFIGLIIIWALIGFIILFALSIIYSFINILTADKFMTFDLTQMIYLMGYTNYQDYLAHLHDPWTKMPNFNVYNSFIGLIGAISGAIILFFWNINIIKRIINVVFLYLSIFIITPTVIKDENWSRFIIWKDKLFASIISSLVIIMSILIFYTITPPILELFSKVYPEDMYVYFAFTILWICGGGFGSYQAVQFIINIFENSISVDNNVPIIKNIPNSAKNKIKNVSLKNTKVKTGNFFTKTMKKNMWS